MTRNITTRLAALTLLATVLAFGSMHVHAQAVYRIVGPDGRVTFSDKPPPAAAGKATAIDTGTSGPAASGSALPFELKQVAGKYPVTLYTGSNCGPCGSGRAMLSSRGVPFTERTVNTAQDADALQRLSGDNTLPLLTIGGQQLKGYSDTEWNQFLDAAGYPKTSQLPASYRNPPAAPLVAVQKQAPTTSATGNTAQEPLAAPAPRPAPDRSGVDNPAGIRF
jgi:glutaredoxin